MFSFHIAGYAGNGDSYWSTLPIDVTVFAENRREAIKKAEKISGYRISNSHLKVTATECEPPKPMTNADRFRSMTDEELAIFINRVKEPCDWCHLMDTEGACTETLCDDAREKWLKQPCEEADNGKQA